VSTQGRVLYAVGIQSNVLMWKADATLSLQGNLVLPDEVWRKRWILHVSARGNGEQAVLDFLARYVFRVALTNARIVGLDDQTVTIQYKDRKTGCRRDCRLSGDKFMRRFLQHVLPRGFHKIRYSACASRATPERHPDTADAATAGAFEDRLDTRRPCRSPARTTRRGAGAADRAADLSALSGAAGLHPHAHPPPGHGAMIRGTRHHHGLACWCASHRRHGGPLLSMQFTAITLAQITTPTIPELPSSTVMLRSCRSGRDGRGTPIRLGTKRPG
jgi:hypothetical protein